MSSSDLIHEARKHVVAACAHVIERRNQDASSVMRFFLMDKIDEGFTVPEVLDAMVKAAISVSVMIAEDDPEVFSRIAIGMALDQAGL